MNNRERVGWDRRWTETGLAASDMVGPYPLFGSSEHLFPTDGSCLEIACGNGRGAVWLARRGLRVAAVDSSPVAIDLARRHAHRCGVTDRCRFDVHDLDDGLPAGEPVDVALCYLFRDPRLDVGLIDRVRPGGILAIACLSEVGAQPGRFRAAPGELEGAFGHLTVLESGEADGSAWLIIQK